MTDSTSQQGANEVELVPNRPIARVGFLHAFVVQSDWEGRVAQETWYGHHSPWCRILLFLLLSSLVSSWHLFATVRSAPVFAADFTFEALTDAYLSCLDSLCEAVQEAPVACELNRYGQAHVVWDGYDGYDKVPMPKECPAAVRSLFNLDLEAEEWKTLPIWDFLKVRGPMDPANQTAWFTLKEDQCVLIIDVYSQHSEPIQLVPSDHEPGRVPNVLEHRFCRENWNENWNDTSPYFFTSAEWLFHNRLAIAPWAIIGGSVTMNLASLCGLMVQLLLTTMVIRAVLPSPSRDFVGLQQITFWSTRCTLVLLSTLNSKWGTVELFAVLIAGSFYYKEKRAALEWTFLAVLNLWFDSIHPILDGIVSAIQTVDALNLVGFVGTVVGWIIPGFGWWKLVQFYFFCSAYPPMRQWFQSKLPGSSAQRDHQQQHQQQQEPANADTPTFIK